MSPIDLQNRRLYVLGAGPGDPELITLKGYRLLQQAKVVLYDNLANTDLLKFVPQNCELVYVGKHPYGEYTPQERIHELILEKATQHGEVIRMKGGDPFIFGRGYEEILFAQAHNIDAFYIPGITSMQTAGFAGVPLTHRTLSEGIWVITGTKKDGRLSTDLKLAMKSNATVVIYMGMKKINEIANAYIEEGRGEVPALIIQHATLSKEKSAKGTVAELPFLAEKYGLTHPAIIIIGEVAGIGLR